MRTISISVAVSFAVAASGMACTLLTSLDDLSTPVDAGLLTSEGGTPPPGTACDASLATDIDNCGTCGNRCTIRANGFPACASGKCATVCNAGFGDCDGVEANGCESTVNVDAANCGRCGRNCRGGACVDGVCQQVILAQNQSKAYGMAIDAQAIYWTNSGSGEIQTCTKPTCAGGPRTIATNPPNAFFVSVDATHIYWNNNSEGKMYRCPLAGCGANAQVLTNIASPTLNVVDADYLYWSGNGGDVNRMLKAGGAAPQPIMTGLMDPVGLALLGTDVYVATRGGAKIYRAPKTGGPPQPVADAPGGAEAIMADGADVYWGTQTGVLTRYRDGVATPLATTAAMGYALAVTKDDVFWTTVSPVTKGIIYSLPKAGGVARALATNQPRPVALVVDDEAIYWTCADSNQVVMLVR